MHTKDKKVFGKALMALTIVFFYLPIVFMVIFSFNDSKSLTAFTEIGRASCRERV